MAASKHGSHFLPSLCFEKFRSACFAFSKKGKFKRRRETTRNRWQGSRTSPEFANDAKRFVLNVKRRPRASKKKKFYSRDAWRSFCLSPCCWQQAIRIVENDKGTEVRVVDRFYSIMDEVYRITENIYNK